MPTMDRQQVNVILLGTAFHLIFFSFQTSVFIQQTVVNSIREKAHYNFKGDGYISLCVTYVVFALSNWLAPSMIALTGLRYGMFLGALTYALYSASFIYPTTALFYAAAALIGLGAGPLWTAQGSYLARNSDAHSSSRNAAIFWSMLQSSILFGNVFVYFAFNKQTVISDLTRYIVYGVLTLVAALGALVLLFLRDGQAASSSSPSLATPHSPKGDGESPTTAWGQFCGALRLARTLDMLLLAVAFLFTGLLLSFFTGVYGTAIGATPQFGLDAKKFIGLSGIFIGVGEILGGSVFGLLGSRVTKRMGRDSIFVMGYLATLAAMALIYVNLPADSSIRERALAAPIIEPRIWIAMLSSLLIGLGDACFNTQVYSLLMSVYSKNSLAAFALFKFVQSLGSAAAFLYSTKFDLHYQLVLLAVAASLATVSFCLVEWRSRRTRLASINKSDSQQSIVSDKQPTYSGNYHQTTAPNKRALEFI